MLAIISLCSSLILAELAIRRLVPSDTGSSLEYRIPHPTLGWVLEPGVTYSNRLLETTARVTYNVEGWRDLDRTIENPARRFRILVLGDSFMEAYSVNLDRAFHQQMQTLAGEAGHRLETINLGVGGYGTLQEYLAFREMGQRYGADLVLLGFYVANDVRNNSLELEQMMNSNPLKVSSRPFLDPDPTQPWQISQIDFEAAQRRYEMARSQQNSPLYQFANQFILFRVGQRVVTEKFQLNTSSPRHTRQTSTASDLNDREQLELALYGINYCEEPLEYTRAWNLTSRILARLKRDVEAAGSQLIVFSVPALEEVSPKEWQKVKSKVTDPNRLCLADAPGHQRLKAILETLDIDFVDLLPDFRQAAQIEETELFWQSERHWNPAAHALAAKQVLSFLSKKHHLPSADPNIKGPPQ